MYCRRLLGAIFMAALMLVGNKTLKAQEVTTYQYRQVPDNKVEEFIKRETTYWSKVAKKAIDKGTLLFWGLFEKIGGNDLENSPNYLFINTYKDIDADLGDVWNPTPLFPGIPIAKMETNSMSKTTATIFLKNDGWQQAEKAVPEKDFRFVVLNYHNSTNPSQFMAIEKNQWGPFIKEAMDKNQTYQKGWGNSIVLSPTGGSMKFNCLSFDLFPNLKGALMQTWSSDTKFPSAGLDSLQKIIAGDPERVIYRVVKVESKN
ncbi:MAG: hypothetical protein ABI416_17895 [Ginsengibacter sp.]